MSISSMSDAKLMRERPPQRAAYPIEKALGLKNLVEREQASEESTPKPPTVPPTVLGQLVRWIPTETITLYVAFVALLNPITAPTGMKLCAVEDAFWGRWITVVAFVPLTVLFVVLIHAAKVGRTHEPFRWPKFEMAAASVAFLAWALALPDTPLRTLCSYKAEIGGFVVLATTVLIALVADALGRNIDPPANV